MRTLVSFFVACLALGTAANAFAVCSTPPIANTDVYNIAKNTTVSIYDSAIVANDTDADAGDTLRAGVSGAPSVGYFCGIAPDGVCYSPPTNFTGLVSIPYQVVDTCNNVDGGTILVFVS
jgi:hypothetical protein